MQRPRRSIRRLNDNDRMEVRSDQVLGCARQPGGSPRFRLGAASVLKFRMLIAAAGRRRRDSSSRRSGLAVRGSVGK